MLIHRLGFTILTILIATCCGCHEQPSNPDWVVINAKIWTGDRDRPSAEVLAVRNGRFTYVGNSEKEARRSTGKKARTLQANGARIVPGLTDAHVHLLGGGLQLSRLNLRDAPNRSAFIEAVAARAKKTPEGQWILGGRWTTESWPDPTQPTKRWIDPVTPNHPALLSRMDGHGALANSLALKRAGIDRHGPSDPTGGEIVRDPATNEPTGILRESAIELVRQHIPAPSVQMKDQALEAAMSEANRHGITCVHTMSDWSAFSVFDRARKSGRLTLRIRQYVNESDWNRFIDKAKKKRNDHWLSIIGFKQFMDGSLGSRTAYMAEPYADNPPDQPDRRGLLLEVMHTKDKLRRMCQAAVAAGFGTAIHAIGDQANHLVLNIYENLQTTSSTRHPCLRIEHAQHLLPEDIARFAKLGVVASMQPLHKADDARYAEQAIGPARCQTSYAFRSLLDAGAPLAFGSDWPVVSLNPFLGLHAATTGRTLDGAVFVPEQNITIEEALHAYTTGPAYAVGNHDHHGKIKTGYLADFVILDKDPFSIAPDAVKQIEASETYVSGRRVWPK
ncbi:MAG: amidohydrolase [Phycisphaerales bacterium]|nr:amidohydrolase [Phycisphaerales bacterium]